MITIPLLNGAENAHQVFTIQLGDNLLVFTVNYITEAGPAWSVDITREGVTLISGAMLEPNAIITENYNAGIGRLVFIGAEVTLDNLGTDNRLVWVSDDE
jgi:hypothetical protein